MDLISDRLIDLDDRVKDVNAQYNMLLERVDNVVDVDIPDLQAQVERLQEQFEGLPSSSMECAVEPPLCERDDVKESLESLRELVHGTSSRVTSIFFSFLPFLEMRKLREATEKHMTTELEAVRAARDEALATIEAHVKAQVCMISRFPLVRRV